MILDDATFIQRALKSYSNIQCVSLDEFQDDLSRIAKIKKSITRYKKGEELNIRLTLNHCVVLFNVFGQTAFDLLRYKIEHDYYDVLYVFLIAINRLPESEITVLDPAIIEQIRNELK